MTVKKRIRIRINPQFLEDYDTLGKRGNTNYEDCPFQIQKDVFMMATTCGFFKYQQEDLPSITHDLFGTEVLDELDIASLTAMYMKYNAMDIEGTLKDQEQIIKQAEKWAEAGFKWLKIYIIGDYDQANMYSLCDWLRDEKWYREKKESKAKK